MTYLALNVLFVAAALAVFGLAVWRRRLTRGRLGAVGITLLVVLALTAAFDNLMIAGGLFAYDPALLTGLALGLAPLEDFAYPLAAAVLLPALWALLGPADE